MGNKQRRRRMTSSRGLLAAVVASGLLATVSTLAAAPSLKLEPGRYVVTVTYEVQDQRQNEPRTTTRCITRLDLNDPEKIFNDQTSSPAQNGEACSVKSLKTVNRTVSYEADCANRTVQVKGMLGSDGFSVVRTVMPKGNQGVSLKFTVRGERTGDCSSR